MFPRKIENSELETITGATLRDGEVDSGRDEVIYH